MIAWLNESRERRLEILEQVSAETGISATAIEKDWWVTIALKAIFQTNEGKNLIFKGGTSLSKCYGLIERFSEDIDLVLSRERLGYKEHELSRNRIEGELKAKSCAYVSGELLHALTGKLTELGIEEDFELVAKEVERPETDPQILYLNYLSITEKVPYLKPDVQIEVGARALNEPAEDKDVQSIIGQTFPAASFSDTAFQVPTVMPMRTMLEKAFLLHEEFKRVPEKIRFARMSRHLYDLHKLMDAKECINALTNTDLYNTIVAHRWKFTRVGGVDYSTHAPKRIEIIPPASVLNKYEADYKTMCDSMIYDLKAPSFEELIERIRQLQQRFRNAAIVFVDPTTA
jgi:hypothetical protein